MSTIFNQHHDQSIQQTQSLVKRISVIMILLGSIMILLATSPSDIPSVDAQADGSLASEEKSISFQVSYRNGPVDFETYPLLVEFKISHQEVAEDFKFDGQSWTIVTETLDGNQRRQQVALRRGSDEIFVIDYEKLTLSGMISLLQCTSEGDANTLCIPCDVSEARCDFSISLVREGSPYPASEVRIDASQWTEEGAKFSIDVTRR